MTKRKSSAEAAADYAAKDYYIAQRTDLLKSAFNAGASWLFNNQWHDVYEEAPPKSGQYLVIYLMDKGEKEPPEQRYVQVFDILVYLKDNEDEGLLPWGLDDEYEYLANAMPNDWWILGFDTCHYCDNPTNWTREDVIAETMQLKKQLENLWHD